MNLSPAITEPTAPTLSGVRVVQIEKHAGPHAVGCDDVVPVEEPLEIRLGYDRAGVRVGRTLAVTMRTPGHDGELAVGFLVGEGLLRARDELAEVRVVGANVVQVELAAGLTPDLRALDRNFYTTSSCGVCGKTSLDAVRAVIRTPLTPGRPQVARAMVPDLPELLRAAQPVFAHTGGLHAAGLFDAAGRLLLAREDVGRHNAVDKLVGARLLAGALPASEAVLVLSGRASFELVQKALLAGIPVIAAVGAPSSLAVALAAEFGATLLGFVRPGRFNVYAGAERIAAASAHE
jgi:FdhD protein